MLKELNTDFYTLSEIENTSALLTSFLDKILRIFTHNSCKRPGHISESGVVLIVLSLNAVKLECEVIQEPGSGCYFIRST